MSNAHFVLPFYISIMSIRKSGNVNFYVSEEIQYCVQGIHKMYPFIWQSLVKCLVISLRLATQVLYFSI